MIEYDKYMSNEKRTNDFLDLSENALLEKINNVGGNTPDNEFAKSVLEVKLIHRLKELVDSNERYSKKLIILTMVLIILAGITIMPLIYDFLIQFTNFLQR